MSNAEKQAAWRARRDAELIALRAEVVALRQKVQSGAQMPAEAPLHTGALKPHALARLVPEMLRDEYLALVDDIKRHGLRQPLVLFEGKILDGRQRYKACTELGIVAAVVEFKGTEAEARAFVISMNAHRRHLFFDQRIKIVNAERKRDAKSPDRAIAATSVRDEHEAARGVVGEFVGQTDEHLRIHRELKKREPEQTQRFLDHLARGVGPSYMGDPNVKVERKARKVRQKTAR